MDIRSADPGEAEHISGLALRSKAHWGYTEEFLAACRDELTYIPEQLAAGGFWVLEVDDEIRGFYAMSKISPDAMELDAMFVEPEHIGRGYGQALMDHALAEFKDSALARLVIQADPNAAPFYEHAGARRIGERPSDSIAGRSLPLFEINATETR
jgi:GNAT superfamily N-acetyltransferase